MHDKIIICFHLARKCNRIFFLFFHIFITGVLLVEINITSSRSFIREAIFASSPPLSFPYAVLRKRNASEMREFLFLFSWTLNEISCESSNDNSRLFERIFRWTKSAISSNFRFETKVERNFAVKSVGLVEISRCIDSTVRHTIYAIYPSYNVHEIHDSSSAGVMSRIQTMRNTCLTYQE